ncbi:hypothetical protein MS3_00001441 [Schistosoma haematobium]|uniref:Uncharacterized protein n=1 Tax=Schistosoma haematobium TaxID=6185 RepID=A0A922S671_SCHHA|nr:hypothetical protein MS3_00001441 [Schistosoma haematobium]KAH9595370.1 hypothetical protein MS3_00001441 [Schistosoma haematobium]
MITTGKIILTSTRIQKNGTHNHLFLFLLYYVTYSFPFILILRIFQLIQQLACGENPVLPKVYRVTEWSEFECYHRLQLLKVFLNPCLPFELASNVRTLMQIGQQIWLTMSLESFNLDVYCLSVTHIRESSKVLQIRFPSVASKTLFHVRLSGDPMASSSGCAGFNVAPNARAEAAPIDWIPINSRLHVVKLESSIKV